MIKLILARLQQKYRTMPFPSEKTVPVDRFRGFPLYKAHSDCSGECSKCTDVCPTGAISRESDIRIDMGKCLFCGDCANACANGCISFTNNYRLSARNRGDLIVNEQENEMVCVLDSKMKKLFGRSLKLRQVSAAGCNSCEADTNVLGTIGWDLGRFGIQFVASPRHADGILVTGPVSLNMKLALMKTYEAVPSPKLVIAAGTCAISGGIFAGHDEVNNGIADLLPVDLYIPGCPPHPLTILDGLLRMLGRL
jgi:Ni,Fe-hydrogenase III small subunit/Pyruvate/2-oxoacid:ferredoxin oxidoreductase delta subunit